MSCCLKTTLQKDYCLNSSATVGSDNSFNSLTPQKKNFITHSPNDCNDKERIIVAYLFGIIHYIYKF